MGLTVDVINIGTLSRNTFWDEQTPVRPAHATTTLIRHNGTGIVVDPSLPPELLEHRLLERAGIKSDRIDAVFLTSFSPVHRRGISLFTRADWYISALERDVVLGALNAVLDGDRKDVADVSFEEVEAEAQLLGKLKPAPEKISSKVDFFPSYGAAPGSASLLIKSARTIVVAGDAVVTRDYFDAGRVWDRSADPEQAKESFRELAEIADAIIPGHDNIMYVG